MKRAHGLAAGLNGDPWNMASNSCLTETERFLAVVGPGERVSGSIVLDVPTPTGVVVFAPFSDIAGEWSYGG